jgi:hypothetical protein
MKTNRNTIRVYGDVRMSSAWHEVKKWAKKNVTNEKVAEVSLALAAAVSLCYLGSRVYVGLQNYLMYAY